MGKSIHNTEADHAATMGAMEKGGPVLEFYLVPSPLLMGVKNPCRTFLCRPTALLANKDHGKGREA